MTLSAKDLQALLPQRMSAKRAAHTLEVARETAYLCSVLNVSEPDALGLYSAALLHDITKEEPIERQLARLAVFGLPLSENDLASPETLHALSGYACAREEFELEEPYAHAVLYHSTGGTAPGLLDKILFCADYIEESRPYENCQRMRRQVHSGMEATENLQERLAILNRGVYTIANATLEFLTSRNRFIHPNTLIMRNSLIPSTKGHKA